MSDLGPQSRALIAEADGIDLPTASDKERVRARLALQIGLAAGAGAVAGATAAGAGAKTVGSVASGTGALLLAKLVAGLAVVSVVAAGAVMAGRPDLGTSRALPAAPVSPGARESATEAPPAAAVTTPTAERRDELAEPPAQEQGERTAAVAPPAATAAPLRAATPASAPRAAPKDRATAPAAPPTGWSSAARVTGPNVEGEAALLRTAQAASDAGDGVTALAALDTHARLYPNGVLADQREGERVVALCSMGQVAAAREAAARFLEAHPRASQAERVRRACRLP